MARTVPRGPRPAVHKRSIEWFSTPAGRVGRSVVRHAPVDPRRQSMQPPHRTLIVARLRTGREADVAAAFAASDRSELPHLVGVTSRSLFTFHDLYFHLISSD